MAQVPLNLALGDSPKAGQSLQLMNVVMMLAGATAVGLLGMMAAQAGTNGFYVPTFRGEAGSQSSLWETFTVPVGAPGNTPNLGNNLTSVLTQSVAGALITGTGNIYNMPSASAFTVSYSGATQAGLVVFQTRTFGTELDYSGLRLNYAGGSLSATRTETDRVAVGEPGQPGSGFFVSSAWQWDLAPLNISSYTISFNAAEPSLSFDSASLDTQAVPEPGTLALLAAGVAAVGLGVRRKR